MMENGIMAGSGSPAYISALNVGPDEAAKLRGLGADTPQQLLAQIKAAPAAFARYLGAETAQRIEQRLRQIVPLDQPTEPVFQPGQLGVPLDRSPPDQPLPTVDLVRRDELFDLIQRLKVSRAPSQQIAAAEEELDALFEHSQRRPIAG